MNTIEIQGEELKQSPVYWTAEERRLIREIFSGENDHLTVGELKEKLGVR